MVDVRKAQLKMKVLWLWGIGLFLIACSSVQIEPTPQIVEVEVTRIVETEATRVVEVVENVEVEITRVVQLPVTDTSRIIYQATSGISYETNYSSRDACLRDLSRIVDEALDDYYGRTGAGEVFGTQTLTIGELEKEPSISVMYNCTSRAASFSIFGHGFSKFEVETAVQQVSNQIDLDFPND